MITSFHKLNRKKRMFLLGFGGLTAVRISVSISGIAYQINLPVESLLQIFVKPCSPYILQPSLISSTLLIYFSGLFFKPNIYRMPTLQQSQHLAFLLLPLSHLYENTLWKNRVRLMFVVIHRFLYFALAFAITTLKLPP